MKNNSDYFAFCKSTYTRTWNEAYLIECQGKNSQSAKLAAQRKAIDTTLVESLLHYADIVSEDEIWKNIALVHKLNVANLSDFNISETEQANVLERCLSAHQSWIKSSGHSFERYIASIDNDELQNNEIRFILQSDLTKMIKEGSLNNTSDDIKGLNSWRYPRLWMYSVQNKYTRQSRARRKLFQKCHGGVILVCGCYIRRLFSEYG